MLTPEQVQMYRQKYNITPVPPPGSPNAPTMNPTDKIAALKAGTYGTTPALNPNPTDNEQEGDKGLGGFATGFAKKGLEFGLGATRLIGKGLGDVLNKGSEALGAGDLFKSADIYDPKTQAGQAADLALERQGAAEKAGGTVFDIASIFAQPELAVDKLGLDGLEHLAEKGAISPKTFEQISGAISSKFGKAATKFIGRFIEGSGYGAVQAEGKGETGSDVAKTAAESGLANVVLAPIAEYLSGKALGSKVGKDLQQAYEDIIKTAQNKLNPLGKYTPTEAGNLLGEKTTTKGKGIFKRDVANEPVTGETEQIAQMIQDGKLPKSNTMGEDIQAINQQARIHDQNIDTFIQDPKNNVSFTPKEVDNVFNKITAKAKSDRVFLSNTTEEHAYNDVKDIFKEEMGKNPMTMEGLRQTIKNFNSRMEDIFDKTIYKDTEGVPSTINEARIKAAKDIRSGFGDFMQDEMNTNEALRLSKNLNPKDARPLIDKAKNFPKKEDFIRNIKETAVEPTPEGSGKPGGTKMKPTKDLLRPDTDFVSRRNPQTGYTTTSDEDLGEIWDIAHTDVKGTAGDVFKGELQKEAQLLNARDTMKYRGRGTLGKSKFEIYMKSPKGKLLQKGLKAAGIGLSALELEHLIKGD